MDNQGVDIFGGTGPDQPGASPNAEAYVPTEQEKRDVKRRCDTIRADREFFKKVFDRMRHDMYVATYGRDKTWPADNYTANITGRHIKQRAAALYAKNPKVSATRSESMDFAVWDENPGSLELAQQTIMAAQATMQPDPATGVPVPDPTIAQALDQAMAVMQDFQQGMARRQMIAKIGRTLEILYTKQMEQQQPLGFKAAMKQLVRRVCVAKVGYVKLGFERKTAPDPSIANQITDAKERLAHLETLAKGLADGTFDDTSAERAELEASLAALQAQPEIVVREGLIVDYPKATAVIPDKATVSLNGFVGADHLTVQHIYTTEKVKDVFGVDLKTGGYTPYVKDRDGRDDSANTVQDDAYDIAKPGTGGFVCIWEHYDRPSGLVYWLAEGCDYYLRPPAAPDVFVESFWPVYALTFNAVENEGELFPPSDVELMEHQQKEVNRSRQGKREHRDAARPRWLSARGLFDKDDQTALATLKPFETMFANIPPDQDIKKLLQPIPVPGVDPNLYDTNEVMMDMQFTVGAQEAQLGGVSKATATEAAIASNATSSTDGAAIDDLDEFLSVIARSGGQILLAEMSEEEVKKIVGAGAVWPQLSLSDIAGELALEVAAGSTGKPNQAVEVNNWKVLGPILQTTPGVSPDWFAKETVRRLDDKLDVNEALVAGLPSMVAQNALASRPPMAPGGPAPGQGGAPKGGDAQRDPSSQGANGAMNAPAPPAGDGGSDAAFGSNQVMN